MQSLLRGDCFAQVAQLFTAARTAVKNGRLKDVTLFTVKGSHIGFGTPSCHPCKIPLHYHAPQFVPSNPCTVIIQGTLNYIGCPFLLVTCLSCPALLLLTLLECVFMFCSTVRFRVTCTFIPNTFKTSLTWLHLQRTK